MCWIFLSWISSCRSLRLLTAPARSSFSVYVEGCQSATSPWSLMLTVLSCGWALQTADNKHLLRVASAYFVFQ